MIHGVSLHSLIALEALDAKGKTAVRVELLAATAASTTPMATAEASTITHNHTAVNIEDAYHAAVVVHGPTAGRAPRKGESATRPRSTKTSDVVSPFISYSLRSPECYVTAQCSFCLGTRVTANVHTSDALAPAERALYSTNTRLAKHRIYWGFYPEKDPRVLRVLNWAQQHSDELAKLGVGAVFTYGNLD